MKHRLDSTWCERMPIVWRRLGLVVRRGRWRWAPGALPEAGGVAAGRHAAVVDHVAVAVY